MKKVLAGVVVAAFCIGIMGCGKAELEAKNKEIADLNAKVTTLEEENKGLKESVAKLEVEKNKLMESINSGKKKGTGRRAGTRSR